MKGLLLNVELKSEKNSYTKEKIIKKSPILWTLILIFLISSISIFYKIVFTIQNKKIKYLFFIICRNICNR
jgi:hypothetical protein